MVVTGERIASVADVKESYGMLRQYFWILLLILLSGCGDSTDWCDVGNSDGYAVGYNETCKIRSTMIHGKWDNADYSRCYASGYQAGAQACLRDK